jgi:hypothetical protein
MRMKSRNVIAVRLDGTDHPVGVLVFESRKKLADASSGCVIRGDDVIARMKGPDGARLASLLNDCGPLLATLSPVDKAT